MPNGKNTLSYKRKVVKESNDIVVGSKSLALAHQATAGETFIPFNALVQPTRWVESGLSNPNGSTLLSLQLQAFAKNIEVSSSVKGYIQKEEYVVKNNGIYFKDFTADANEVFEVVVGDMLVTGNRLVDMRTIRVEGELLNTETDFVIGNQVDVFNEEIIVFRDGLQMFRSENNDDSGATGNYYYLDSDGDGKSNTIRFFDAAVGTEAILVASTGGIVDAPNVSTFQQIETLAGQIDAVIPTVAALAGVPESDFRSGPNNVDLRNFGQKVLDVFNVLFGTLAIPASFLSKLKAVFGKTEYQYKFLQANIDNTTGIINDLTFNNLEVGKKYKIVFFYSSRQTGSNNSNSDISCLNGTTLIGNVSNRDDTATVGILNFIGLNTVFDATDTTVTFEINIATNFRLSGNGTLEQTWAKLEELPNHEETTKWN